MKFLHWLADELRSVIVVTAYFAACFVMVMLLMEILLADYGIEFRGLSTALLVALVTAKVLIVLDKIPLSPWMQRQPAIAHVVMRSAIYTLATLAVLLVEKTFESSAEYGGLTNAAMHVFEHRDIHRVWATAICVSLAFLAYNGFAVLRRDIGARRLAELFFAKSMPVPSVPKEKHP